jgi:serine protease Do
VARAIWFTLWLIFPPAVLAFSDLPEQLQKSVFKVNAVRSDGSVSTGSAVTIAPEKLVTNCHVLRYAREIKVFEGDRVWNASLGSHDSELDLCMLIVSGFEGRTVRFGSTWDIAPDQAVAAVGYPEGGGFTMDAGSVKALYPYRGGKVVRTSACFHPGESGGGLFDEEGRLVGILTFRAVAGGDFHFVLPVEWVLKLADETGIGAVQPPTAKAFFEQESYRQPFFLQAAAHEERRNWHGLFRLAQKWSGVEANASGAWIAMGRACEKLQRQVDAVTAYQRALEIDPEDPEGAMALNKSLRYLSSDPSCQRYSWCNETALLKLRRQLATAQ